MHPADKRDRRHPVKEGNRIAAHGHTAKCSQGKTDQEQDIQYSRYGPIKAVFPLAQRAVPFPVQDLMDDDKHRHAYTGPFMRHLSRHLIGHETEEEDSHGCIHDSFHYVARSESGQGTVPPFFLENFIPCRKMSLSFPAGNDVYFNPSIQD